MTKWQPIETAPKDGTPILVYIPDDWPEDRITTVRWVDCDWELCQVWRWSQDNKPSMDPSYWMPLPPPPGK